MIRLEVEELDTERRRWEGIATIHDVPDDVRAAAWIQDPSGDVERIARELAALLRVEASGVDVRGLFDARRWRLQPLEKRITIRVPARHWEGLLTELDAVAAMLPDSAAGAEVVIEDDSPPSQESLREKFTWVGRAAQNWVNDQLVKSLSGPIGRTTGTLEWRLSLADETQIQNLALVALRRHDIRVEARDISIDCDDAHTLHVRIADHVKVTPEARDALEQAMAGTLQAPMLRPR